MVRSGSEKPGSPNIPFVSKLHIYLLLTTFLDTPDLRQLADAAYSTIQSTPSPLRQDPLPATLLTADAITSLSLPPPKPKRKRKKQCTLAVLMFSSGCLNRFGFYCVVVL